jgi:agmatinase
VVIRKPSTDAIPRGGEGIVRHGAATFFGAPMVEDISELSHALSGRAADVAFLGVPFDGATNDRPGSRFGPAAVRDASMRFQSVNRDGWFDVQRGVQVLRDVSMLDVGDVDIRTVDLVDNFERISEAARLVTRSGALPAFVGGDHAITFPLVRAFEGRDLTVVQFDAHQDFTDEKFGVRYSHDNQMRRVSELAHVRHIVQIGIRGMLERREPWDAALARGVDIVPAWRILEEGVAEALAGLHVEGDCYLTIDVDVLDPATAPGTGFPEPGGLSYGQLRRALETILQRCRLVAFDVTEINPVYDYPGVTARTVARLILDVLAAALDPAGP